MTPRMSRIEVRRLIQFNGNGRCQGRSLATRTEKGAPSHGFCTPIAAELDKSLFISNVPIEKEFIDKKQD